MRKKIITDICGADADASVIARGAVSALIGQDEFDLVLCGPRAVIEEAVPEELAERVEIIEADEFVTNFDDPREMIKGKTGTTMVKALDALKARDDIAGLVSAGSTGCLMIGSIFHVGLMGKLLQPALSSALPHTKGSLFCLVDCGANINCKVRDYVDWANMGSAFMQAMIGVESPQTALVNVGAEKGKGTALVQEAYEALEDDERINFIGNIEGSEVLTGKADVVVCDGFTGNILLKNMEACGLIAARMMGDPENVVGFFDYNSQGGATFLGTKKIIVKAHGAANESTVKACIDQAWRLEKGGFTEKLKERMG